MNEKTFYGLKNDYMFHAVMQDSRKALEDLISALTDIPKDKIEECCVENPIIYGEDIRAKDIMLDVRILLNNQVRIDVELQVECQQSWPERSLLYWCRLFDTLQAGEWYDQLKPTYHIGILNFTLDKENPEFYSEYRIMNVKTGRIYTDHLVIRDMDLTKVELAIESPQERELKDWALLFRAQSIEEFQMLAHGNEVFENMAVTLEKYNEDARIREQCLAREFRQMDLLQQYHSGRKDGKAEGIAEGKAEGKDVMSRLLSLLIAEERLDDVKRISSDPAFREELIKEYGLE